MLEVKKCILVVVDVQGRLARLMHEKEELFNNISILIKAATILNIPIVWSQQCPAALGPTVPQIAELLGGCEPVNKAAFSCWADEQFRAGVNELGRQQVLLCGIEAHICIYQTAVDLRQSGFEVHVVSDAVSSRALCNKQLALDRMAAERIKLSCVEMALFELLRTAEHVKFKEVAALIK